ncbi:MAG TPA: saccharopine dehydrogenase [Bacteroidales bacterium]|nr:MAG: saccharopine dehydrogenase [Bacteroidetes bacterium GWF2_33_38]HBF88390.1 saccharopine dehydrogenase [Bacteroidales bacterium]
MKKILILGAGLSSSSLIKYLLDHSIEHNWKIKIGDIEKEIAEQKINKHPNGEGFKFDVFNDNQRENEIKNVDVVISMLPARMHYLAAKDCVKHSVHMITASYVSPEIRELNNEAKKKGVLLLNEIGVDPGIDHMSAMKIIDKINEDGGTLEHFRSYTGGLVAPESDNNPWNYKFTWNPRNVVLAGQGVSKFLLNGKYKYIPYNKLFSRTEIVAVPEYGNFEVYANRDSLSYREVYNLQHVKTLYRGTMRRPGYCESWNVFVQLGLTDDTYLIEDSENMTYRDFIDSYLSYSDSVSVEEKVAKYVDISIDSDIMKKIAWTGIFESKKIGLTKATPAQILQKLLVEKWGLDKNDIDMIVMQHRFHYTKNNRKKLLVSSLVVKGIDTVHTAMSITVGIPVAIATKMLLTGKMTCTGVQVPISKEIYEPVLKELEEWKIKFIEEEFDV